MPRQYHTQCLRCPKRPQGSACPSVLPQPWQPRSSHCLCGFAFSRMPCSRNHPAWPLHIHLLPSVIGVYEHAAVHVGFQEDGLGGRESPAGSRESFPSNPSLSVVSRATMETKSGSPRNGQTGLTRSGFPGSPGSPLWEKVTGTGQEWGAGFSLSQASPRRFQGSALGPSVSPRPGAEVAWGQVRLQVVT